MNSAVDLSSPRHGESSIGLGAVNIPRRNCRVLTGSSFTCETVWSRSQRNPV